MGFKFFHETNSRSAFALGDFVAKAWKMVVLTDAGGGIEGN